MNSREHVFEELRRLDLMLNLQVARQRHDPAYAGFNEFRGLFISEEEIDRMSAIKSHKSESHAQNEAETSALLAAIRQSERHITHETTMALEQGVHLSLQRLSQLFELSRFDIDVLLVCLAPELDSKYERLYAYLQNDVTRKRPSADLVLNLLCHSLEERLWARGRLLAEAPLFSNHLISYAGDAHNEPTTWLSCALKIDSRILNYILDVQTRDEQLAPFVTLVRPRASLAHLLLPAETKEDLVRFFQWQVTSQAYYEISGARVLLFEGSSGVGKKFTAEALCCSAGLELLVADVPRMISGGSHIASLVRRLFREAKLRSAAVYLDHAESLLSENEREAGARQALLQALREFTGIIFMGSRQPWIPSSDAQAELFFKVSFPVPDYSLRRQLWETLLAEEGQRVAPDVDTGGLADKFAFTAGKIRSAIADAKHRAMMRHQAAYEISADDLYRACRAQTSKRLMTLARKITPLYTWSDIILPHDHLLHLQEVCTHVKHRQRVFSEWGFNRKISLGKGLGILFAGPSGTGKTMAAEIITGELGLDLYKIDLSCVVSKYIGETEKNLSQIFEEAEQSNAVLFFDEADAIFGKRSEVKDSHDRYANIEINYLLQKMEEYEGIVILASNFQKNIDESFTRRLRFVIEFPFPEADYRHRIWKKVFPLDTPLGDDIDFAFLSQKLKLTGGNIRNIALSAAFLAAENSGHVHMEHIICATKREFQKMGRLCVKADFDQYFELVGSEEVAR